MKASQSPATLYFRTHDFKSDKPVEYSRRQSLSAPIMTASAGADVQPRDSHGGSAKNPAGTRHSSLPGRSPSCRLLAAPQSRPGQLAGRPIGAAGERRQSKCAHPARGSRIVRARGRLWENIKGPRMLERVHIICFSLRRISIVSEI